ncbi:MAG: hypothetical protein F6J93_13375 [Oscillatoria sp. SIO1A7]|nr:hypothetical protein [Oscillatoria sp. SIO1A7]
MISRAFVVSFVTLATTSLLFAPSASAVEIMAKEAEGDRTEIAETKCSDKGSDHKCPPLRNDSVSATGNTASLKSLIPEEIEAIANKNNTKEVCEDENGTVIKCPTVK